MKKILFLLVITFLVYSCKDSDNDQVLDKNDKCPNIYGLIKFDGCPDSDGDGIIDQEDDCPEEYGMEKFNGCADAGKVELIAADCFKIYKLTSNEVEKCINLFNLNNNSLITFSMCEIIGEYIYKMNEINQKINELEKMKDEGYITDVHTMTIGGVRNQEIFVKKHGKIYHLSVLGSRTCPMGTMVFDENNKYYQEVFVRPDPSSLSYQVFQMKIIQAY